MSVPLEKQIRLQVRKLVVASPELKRERKRRKGRTPTPAWLVRFITAGILVGALTTPDGRDLWTVSFIMMLWGLRAALNLSHDFTQAAHQPGLFLPLCNAPVGDEALFDWTARRFTKQACWVIHDFVLAWFFSALILEWGAWVPLDWYWAILLGILQALLAVACAIHLARVYSDWFVILGAMLGLAAFLALFLPGVVSTPSSITSQLLLWCTPVGWVNQLFFSGLTLPWKLSLLLLIGSILITARGSWMVLRRSYSLPSIESSLVTSPIQPGREEAEPAHSPGQTEIEDTILTGEFLNPPKWVPGNWASRTFERLLNPRGRLVAEFLLGGTPGFGLRLRPFVITTAIACCVVGLFGKNATVLFFAAAYYAALLLPITQSGWQGLVTRPSGGVTIPLFAIVPIGFSEMLVTMCMGNLIQCAIALPWVAMFSGFCGWRFGQGPWAGVQMGLIIGVKAVALIATLQPLILVTTVSNKTRDTTQVRWWWQGSFALLLLVILGLGIAVFFVNWPFSFAAIAIIAIFSIFGAWMYGRAFDRLKFDLLTKGSGTEGL